MLEVVPVSLFQMRGPYKLLVPASTDKLNLNTLKLLLTMLGKHFQNESSAFFNLTL